MSFSYYQKIEKLQSSLHLLGEKDDSQPTNQHIVFVDTNKEGKCHSCPLKSRVLPGVFSEYNTVSSVKGNTFRTHSNCPPFRDLK